MCTLPLRLMSLAQLSGSIQLPLPMEPLQVCSHPLARQTLVFRVLETNGDSLQLLYLVVLVLPHGLKLSLIHI